MGEPKSSGWRNPQPLIPNPKTPPPQYRHPVILVLVFHPSLPRMSATLTDASDALPNEILSIILSLTDVLTTIFTKLDTILLQCDIITIAEVLVATIPPYTRTGRFWFNESPPISSLFNQNYYLGYTYLIYSCNNWHLTQTHECSYICTRSLLPSANI